MNEQRTALGATGYVAAARVLRASARIVIVLLLARFYTDVDVAMFAYAFVATTLIGFVCDLGLTDYAVREIASAPAPHAVALAVLKLRCVTAPIAIGAGYVMIVATSDTPPLVALAVAAYATSLAVSDLLGGIQRAHGRYAGDALETGMPIVALMAAAACAASGTSSLVFFETLGIGGTVVVGVRIATALWRARAGSGEVRVSASALLRDSRWFAVRAIVTAALFEAAVVLLQQLSTTSETAAFAIAQRPVGLMNQSLAVVAFVFLPTLSRTFSTEPARLGAVAAEMNLLYLLLVPAAFGACILGGDLFLAISGEAYTGESELVRWLAIALLLYNGTLAAPPLLAARHERIVVAASAVGVVLLALIGALLVPEHGAYGAAIATGAATAGGKILHVVGYRIAGLPLGDRRHAMALLGAIAFVIATSISGPARLPLLIAGSVLSAWLTAHRLSRTRLAT